MDIRMFPPGLAPNNDDALQAIRDAKHAIRVLEADFDLIVVPGSGATVTEVRNAAQAAINACQVAIAHLSDLIASLRDI